MLLQPLPKILINSKPLARRMGDAVKYPGANPVPHLDKEQGRFGPNGSLRQVQPAVVNEHRPQHHGPRDPPSPPAGKTGLCFPAMQHWARELSAGRLGEEEEQEFSPLPASASIPDQSRDGDISLWQIQARTVGREVPTAPHSPKGQLDHRTGQRSTTASCDSKSFPAMSGSKELQSRERDCTGMPRRSGSALNPPWQWG